MEPCAVFIVLEKIPVPLTVKLPLANVPVVDKFSLPKLIEPFESVILPSAKVNVPIVEPVANVVTPADKVPVTVKFPLANVPVVDKFSLPKLIEPLESVILPFAKVKLPIVEPVAAVIVFENEPVPVTVKFPSTVK